MPHLILIADIGGTSSRLALVSANGVPTHVQIHRNDSFSGFEALIEADLAMRDPATTEAIDGAVLAVAGPANGQFIELTNRDWSLTKRNLRRHFGWHKLTVVNDFEALAYGVTALGPDDLAPIGQAHADKSAPMLVCGPGTGFGSAGLLRLGRGLQRAITGEGGRCRLGATTAEEARLLAHLVGELGPVVVEHALSGSGLSRIHRLFAGEDITPEQVIAAAHRDDDGALASIGIFLRLFGRIAGDLALIFDARGGVFLAGGISAALAPFFEASPFREAFQEHPPFEARLAATPVNVILHPTPGLVGCGQLGGRLAKALRARRAKLNLA
ncbi:glucokinase [Ancylobacter pratisalsi]|uniref:ROK family protein n=1 Tax=Ancylobacter pratisalsi TaxID=1745854 RepID=A0A6P1YJE6_9HYPH|nr:glucokinase [Ancylobacter pratisalsi]QIB33272.1 ROK family protein [Ancylobacter pratisalsi]